MHPPTSHAPVDSPRTGASTPADPPMKYGKPEMSARGQLFVATAAVVTSLSAVILVLWQLLINIGE